MQTHLLPKLLKGGISATGEARVMFSMKPNRKAIVFIHGFNGNAIKTWADFHELLPNSPKSEGRDIYFYGYDGLRSELIASAAIFGNFLNQLFNNITPILKDNLSQPAQRSSSFAYDEIIIVAHSLGAVISRRALLDAPKRGFDWGNKTKLVLYAPAHMGARVVALAIETSSSIPILKYFCSLVRFSSPLVEQLQPGSAVLQALKTDTLSAIVNKNNKHLVAKKVIIAEYEKIVSNDTFAGDPPPVAIPGVNHIGVCKPTKSFNSPLLHLEDCL